MGCKKDKSFFSENTDPNLLGRESIISINLDPRGFLKFNEEDLTEFYSVLSSYSHEDIQESLTEDGFSSLGQLNFNSSNTDFYNIPLEDEQVHYILSEDGIVQVENVIMKISDDFTYVIAVTEENIDSTIFNMLKEGYYDSDKMNKFTFSQDGNELDIVEFALVMPSGHEDSAPVGQYRVPFWGTTTTYVLTWIPNAENPGMCNFATYKYHRVYRFWKMTDEYWGNIVENSTYMASCP